MRVRAKDPIAQLLLEAGHHRQRDDDRADADGDTDDRNQRDDRDERLLPLREQVADGDVELEGDLHQWLVARGS